MIGFVLKLATTGAYLGTLKIFLSSLKRAKNVSFVFTKEEEKKGSLEKRAPKLES